jgi:hypothetical protein
VKVEDQVESKVSRRANGCCIAWVVKRELKAFPDSLGNMSQHAI